MSAVDAYQWWPAECAACSRRRSSGRRHASLNDGSQEESEQFAVAGERRDIEAVDLAVVVIATKSGRFVGERLEFERDRLARS